MFKQKYVCVEERRNGTAVKPPRRNGREKRGAREEAAKGGGWATQWPRCQKYWRGKKVVSGQEKGKPRREPQISRFGFTP